jgi:hypothetical protein
MKRIKCAQFLARVYLSLGYLQYLLYLTTRDLNLIVSVLHEPISPSILRISSVHTTAREVNKRLFGASNIKTVKLPRAFVFILDRTFRIRIKQSCGSGSVEGPMPVPISDFNHFIIVRSLNLLHLPCRSPYCAGQVSTTSNSLFWLTSLQQHPPQNVRKIGIEGSTETTTSVVAFTWYYYAYGREIAHSRLLEVAGRQSRRVWY